MNRRSIRSATALPAALATALVTTLVVGLAGPAAAADAPPPNSVSAFGSAPDYGPQGMTLNSPLVGMAARPTGAGYWLVAADGGIFSFGDASFFGSTGSLRLNKPIVGMASTPSGNGYWLVAADGGIFAFGDAAFHGSTGSIHLNQPVVGMTATPTGGGYWLVASDGGIFAFGDAAFFGSTGSIHLNQPVVGMASTTTGGGYWLVAADGGIFAFGNAPFFGSAGGGAVPAPITGMTADPGGNGYCMVARNGQVFAFGVPDFGSGTDDGSLSRPATVAIAARSDGQGYWLANGVAPVTSIQDSGPRVQSIQNRLVSLGYWLGNADGTYGELTRQAVYAFQKLNGLPITGSVDGATADTLNRAGRPTPQSTSGDLIEVDKTHQVLFVVRGGAVQWAFNTSTGTEREYTYEGTTYRADTPVGRFHVSSEVDGIREGNLGRLYRPKYFHPDGVAIHGYSFVPPYPASHGCVRLTNAGIDFVWAQNLAPIGATVLVYGTSPGT